MFFILAASCLVIWSLIFIKVSKVIVPSLSVTGFVTVFRDCIWGVAQGRECLCSTSFDSWDLDFITVQHAVAFFLYMPATVFGLLISGRTRSTKGNISEPNKLACEESLTTNIFMHIRSPKVTRRWYRVKIWRITYLETLNHNKCLEWAERDFFLTVIQGSTSIVHDVARICPEYGANVTQSHKQAIINQE